MPASCDVSVIIVNYNGKKYIDTLFESLCGQKSDGFSFEVVFVDNASSDDSVSYLKEKYADRLDNLVIVESTENLGFAGGNNLGVANAHGEYIVLLNNDTAPNPDWLENLFRYAKSHKDVVMVNSKLLFYYDFIRIRFSTQDKILLSPVVLLNGQEYRLDAKFCKNVLYGPDQITCFGHSEICLPLLFGKTDYSILLRFVQCAPTDRVLFGQMSMAADGRQLEFSLDKPTVEQNAFTLIQNAGSGITENLDGYDIGFCMEDGEEFSREYEVSNGCGAAVMFRKADFEKCGGFDERFFMYYEDTDLSFRMKKDGGKIMYDPDAVVRHFHAGSSGEWSPFFTYHVCKNKLLFVAKNYGRSAFGKYFRRQLLSGIKERNRSKIKGTLQAWRLVSADPEIKGRSA